MNQPKDYEEHPPAAVPRNTKPSGHDHVKLLRTAWPYILAFWGAVVILIKADWIDLPANADDVQKLRRQVEELHTGQKLHGASVDQLKQDAAAAIAVQRAIREQLTRIEKGQDRLLDHLLGHKR